MKSIPKLDIICAFTHNRGIFILRDVSAECFHLLNIIYGTYFYFAVMLAEQSKLNTVPPPVGGRGKSRVATLVMKSGFVRESGVVRSLPM